MRVEQIVLNFDGIWNQGRGMARSTTATTWKDLSSSGNDAVIGKYGSGNASAWTASGYDFKCSGTTNVASSYGYAVTKNNVSVPSDRVTAQVVCNVDTNSQYALWPTLVGAKASPDYFNIYYDRNNYSYTLALKVANAGHTRIARGEWKGRYATAIHEGVTNFLTQTTDKFGGGVGTSEGSITASHTWEKIPNESESEVAQSSPTPSDPMDCSLPGSSIHGSFQARVLE